MIYRDVLGTLPYLGGSALTHFFFSIGFILCYLIGPMNINCASEEVTKDARGTFNDLIIMSFAHLICTVYKIILISLPAPKSTNNNAYWRVVITFLVIVTYLSGLLYLLYRN